VDAVSEFKVITGDSSAEYGYRLGGKVLVSTRSGTNALHGGVYEFLRNDKLDGRISSPTGPGRGNRRTGKTSWRTAGRTGDQEQNVSVGSYQGTRIRIGRSYTASVPSRAALSGDFSRQPAERRNIFDPMTIGGRGRTRYGCRLRAT